jgi:acyl carrier protein
VVELEDSYGVRIPDEEAAKILTVGQAADYVAAHANGTET